MGTVRSIQPYRDGESSLYTELDFLRKENERLRDRVATLDGTVFRPYGYYCHACGENTSQYKGGERVYVHPRRGLKVFGVWLLKPKPAHFARRCNTCGCTWVECLKNGEPNT